MERELKLHRFKPIIDHQTTKIDRISGYLEFMYI